MTKYSTWVQHLPEVNPNITEQFRTIEEQIEDENFRHANTLRKLNQHMIDTKARLIDSLWSHAEIEAAQTQASTEEKQQKKARRAQQ